MNARSRCRRAPLVLLAGLMSVTLSGVAGPGLAAPLPVPSTGPSTAAAQQPRIVPYEVRYQVSLKEARERVGIIIANGELHSRLSGGVCDGWSTSSGMKVRFVFRREGVRETESRVSSWESDDGNQFVSRIERRLNGVPVERIRVMVERARAGEPFRLRLRMPRKSEAELPAATLFPTAAMKTLLTAAREGRRGLSLLLYEGDEEAAPQRVAVIIGPRRAPIAEAGGDGEGRAGDAATSGDVKGVPRALRTRAYWPVSLAYYGAVKQRDAGKADDREQEAARFGLPEYEVHFRLYENGITGDATLVYPDYVLRAKVRELKLLPAAKCN